MPHAVDFISVSTVGLEASPVVGTLVGLRANEARYFKKGYSYVFTVECASIAKTITDWVHSILNEERHIVIFSGPLEVPCSCSRKGAESRSGSARSVIYSQSF